MFNVTTLFERIVSMGADRNKLVTVDIDGKTFVVVGVREDEHEVVMEIPEEGTE